MHYLHNEHILLRIFTFKMFDDGWCLCCDRAAGPHEITEHWLTAVLASWPRFFLLITRRLLSCHMWFSSRMHIMENSKRWSSIKKQLDVRILDTPKVFCEKCPPGRPQASEIWSLTVLSKNFLIVLFLVSESSQKAQHEESLEIWNSKRSQNVFFFCQAA